MKIALALDVFDPHRGDVGAYAFQLAQHLLRLKHDVHVVAEGFSDAGLQIPVVPHRIRSARSPIRRAATAEAKLRSLASDVVHDLGITWYADVFSSDLGSPLAAGDGQMRGVAWWKRPLRRAVQQWSPRVRKQNELAVRQLDNGESIAVAASEMVADDYRSIHGVPPQRIRVVRPGVDIKTFAPHIRKLRRATTRQKLGVGSKDILLLAIADASQQETWRHTFGAVRRLAIGRVPVRLVVVGQRPYLPSAKLAARFGVAEKVRVVGPVADRLPYYAAADVFVAPTYYAPASQPVLEAAACGLPAIVTRQNGVAELLTDGVDSCLLDHLHAATLAEKIRMFGDAVFAERLGRGARRTAMNCPQHRHFAKIVQIYEEVLEARKPTPDVLGLPRRAAARPAVRRAA